MAEHNDLGKWGEDVAASFLERKGYQICDRDWKVGKRDLDIVAMTEDGLQLVFVEVKTRQSADLQEPEQAVDARKIRNLAFAANAYVKAHDLSLQIRFDIITVVGKMKNVEQVEHWIDAFNPMLIL